MVSISLKLQLNTVYVLNMFSEYTWLYLQPPHPPFFSLETKQK